MTTRIAKKTGLNLYRVTFYYHTNGSVDVKASSEEEALELADSSDITNEELLDGLQEDNSPDAELIEENVEPDKAALIDTLKEKLHNGVAHFFYQKLNGELREAFGTLNQSLVAATVNGRGKSRENHTTIAYYDCVCGGWRSFRREALVRVL